MIQGASKSPTGDFFVNVPYVKHARPGLAIEVEGKAWQGEAPHITAKTQLHEDEDERVTGELVGKGVYHIIGSNSLESSGLTSHTK